MKIAFSFNYNLILTQAIYFFGKANYQIVHYCILMCITAL